MSNILHKKGPSERSLFYDFQRSLILLINIKQGMDADRLIVYLSGLNGLTAILLGSILGFIRKSSAVTVRVTPLQIVTKPAGVMACAEL